MSRCRLALARRIVVALTCLLAPVLSSGCALVRSTPPPAPVPPAAERAFADAMLFLRDTGGDGSTVSLARESARRAAQLAPGWIAPLRVLDDIDRAALIGPALLARYESTLARNPDDAPTLYLAGRLDSTARAEVRFRKAVSVDPGFAWGHHGLAWARVLVGDFDGAIDAQHRALELARGSYERSYFAESLARHYAARGKGLHALDVLHMRLSEEDVLPLDKILLGVRLATFELAQPFGRRARVGARRALELLHEGGLTEAETRELVVALVESREIGASVTAAEVRLAVRAVAGPGRERLAAELMLREAPTPLALALLERASADDPSWLALDPKMRAARFAVGDIAPPIEAWLALQPAFARDASGLPRDAALREVVRRSRAAADRARAGDTARYADDLAALGAAMIECGWFVEARGVAQELARHDVERALALDDDATAGVALVSSLVDLIQKVDAREPIVVVDVSDTRRPDDAEVEVKDADLDALLAAMEPRFQRFRDAVEELPGRNEARVRLADSPRLRYGPVGAVVHPGPRFSKSDAALGLGSAGAEVDGLAAEFGAIGRFAVFGEAVGGGGPDGTVLRRLLVEERSGEHFGVPWSGTIAWCDGADLRSRPGRRGARIGGAALHEGYWIDVETLRAEERHYRELEERFLDRDDGAALERALATPPLPRSDDAGTDLPPLLGEADRVRLAVLRERRDAGGSVGLVGLDELVLATATHEEGHLCDRARFLPLSERMWAVMMFFMESGMSAARVEERLEYRAQLTALFDTPDTRLPLAEVLAAAELGSTGVTPHGAAYTRLLQDFLAELGSAVERDPARWSALDRGGHLAHQLHRLSSAEVREIAGELARTEGLFE